MIAETAGAPSNDAQRWQSIDWPEMERRVYRLQVRIAKSIREQRWGKARALQHLLSRSWAAKLLAVNRVISNRSGYKGNTDPRRGHGSANATGGALKVASSMGATTRPRRA